MGSRDLGTKHEKYISQEIRIASPRSIRMLWAQISGAVRSSPPTTRSFESLNLHQPVSIENTYDEDNT
eukprot:667519-Hanusia_phi.AAC.3